MFNQSEGQRSEESNKLKHLTEEEMLDVLETARKISVRDHCLILVAYLYGLRNQEISRLKLTNLDWDKMTITVARLKSSMVTEQPLVRHKGRPALDVVGSLESWLKERQSETDILFPSKKCSTTRGRCLSQQAVNRLFAKYCKLASRSRKDRGLAGIDPKCWHAHAIKHTRGTALAERGVRPLAIKLILGHKSLSSSEKYINPSQKTAWQEERRLMQSAF
jgi:integrase